MKVRIDDHYRQEFVLVRVSIRSWYWPFWRKRLYVRTHARLCKKCLRNHIWQTWSGRGVRCSWNKALNTAYAVRLFQEMHDAKKPENVLALRRVQGGQS